MAPSYLFGYNDARIENAILNVAVVDYKKHNIGEGGDVVFPRPI